MTDAEIKAIANTAMQQLDQLENERDSLKRMVGAYARQNEKLRAENANLQKLLDVERKVTEGIVNRLYDYEVSEHL